jgi:hypothetical protein
MGGAVSGPATEPDDTDAVVALGDALNVCATRALLAYADENGQEAAAEIIGELQAGIAQCECLVVSGVGKPASVSVTAILSDGTRQLLASLRIEPLRFN